MSSEQPSAEPIAPILARLLPFRAIRYTNGHPDIDPGRLIAPPGEGAGEARGVSQHEPYHALRLFPTSGGKTNPTRLEPHEQEQLRSTLQAWWHAGVLTRDESPSIYLHRLTFATEEGTKLTRRGFFAVLGLGPSGSLKVLPHENTLKSRLTRQIQIFEALSTQVLPIFLVYSDPTDSVMRRLEDAAQEAEVLYDFQDAAGQHHRMQRLSGVEIAHWLEAQFTRREVVIADGHHRFDALRAFWSEHGTEHAEELSLPFMPESEAYIGVYLTSVDAPGFRVGAIHRVIRHLPLSHAQLLATLEPLYRRVHLPLDARHPVSSILEHLASAGEGAFGLVMHGEPGWDLIYARSDVAHPALAGEPDELRQLDVTRLHREVLPLLKPEGKNLELEFEKDPHRAFSDVMQGKSALGIFLNPIHAEQIWAVARAGLTMPPKATYFSPKVAAGLVGMPLPGMQRFEGADASAADSEDEALP